MAIAPIGFYTIPGSVVTGDGISMTPPGFVSNPMTGEFHVTAGVIVTPDIMMTTAAYGFVPGVGYYVTPSSITMRR